MTTDRGQKWADALAAVSRIEERRRQLELGLVERGIAQAWINRHLDDLRLTGFTEAEVVAAREAKA